ncbi:hypothetical protein SDRG_07156 [Saprolegnia diclina VS20]|uniref:Uncharacterized protein n=1 Tax=Saprolegnia diclina (strain VS20) TaxID=1156394 RepID=T0QL71_SAPDV|nr:hypothetical protein SDRG_07156 [Saprolegnia diclina VS20]EQC35446.1 hypothetical protein SDRG_07156 [Saprolegnia diclina VS20]|eukprot:XP_008611196.1 hypothetical protein SDRG_07156 [Saprolegnia diclina VS20]
MTCAKVIHHTSTTADSYRVRRNRLGSFICIASMLNVSSMPLAAYISEYLPWRGAFTPPETHANYTSFSAATLALHQERYSNATLPAGTTFLVDDNYNTQVVRALVPVHAQPLRFGDCFATSILGLPGLSFYSDSLNNFVCNVLDNPTTLVANGSCFHLNMLSRPYDRACLWFVPGDGISSHPNKADKVVTLYFVKTELRTPAFAWFLFVYRLGTTLFVWYRLYVHYYRHCLELEARLRRFGHRLKMPAGDWSYEIVLGDPTAIVLMDAWVASLYYLDTWFGCTNIGTATLQMQDSGDALLMLRGVMYLARTVWFAYWGLCLVSYALKRWKKQHAFKEVDPTVVAIVVTINGPAFTFMTGHVVIFARFYQWMFNCLIPRAFQGQEVEVGLVSIIFTVLTIHMPVAYGLVAGM